MRSILIAITLLSLIAPAAYAAFTPETAWSFDAGAVISTAPVMMDIDGVLDKTPAVENYSKYSEVVFGAGDGKVHLLDHTGKELVGWPVTGDNSAPVGIALADLDNKYEGPMPPDFGYHPEVIFITKVGTVSAYDWHGARVWSATSLRATGRPRIADVNGDGWLEVVCETAAGPVILNGRNGLVLGKIALSDPGAGFELADVSEDGIAEIVISSPTNGEMSVVKADGTALPGWPVKLSQAGSAILADINDDGFPEIIVPTAGGVAALKADGLAVAGWPVATEGTIEALAAGDVNRDGKIEVTLVERKPAASAQLLALTGQGKPLPDYPVKLPNTFDGRIVTLTIAPLAGNEAPEIEVFVARTEVSELFAVQGKDGSIPYHETRQGVVSGLALIADQSRTAMVLAEGSKITLLHGPVGSAKPWAFDWPMTGHAPDGNAILGFPLMLADQVSTTPLLVDLDGDGKKEILVGTSDSSGRRGSPNSRVYAIRGNGTLVTGWPVQELEDVRTFAAADLNGDGKTEVVSAGWDGLIHAWEADGSELWPAITPPEKPRHLVGGALADLDGDKKPEIIVGTMITGDKGKVYSYSAEGRLLWQYPKEADKYVLPPCSTPVVGDINGDGKPEIVCTTFDAMSDKGVFSPARYFALRTDGTLLWGNDVAHSVHGALYSPPTLADVNCDGKPEIVFGSTGWMNDAGFLHTDGKLYVVGGDGKPVAGWPVALKDLGEPEGWIYSSPAVADVDGDGKPEIAFGSAGTYCLDASKTWGYNNAGTRLYLLKADGTPVPGWPYDAGQAVFGSPIVTDINGDGKLEVIVGATNKLINSGEKLGRILAVDASGKDLAGWPKSTTEKKVGSATYSVKQLMADPEGAGHIWLFAGAFTTSTAWDPKGSKQGVGRLYRVLCR